MVESWRSPCKGLLEVLPRPFLLVSVFVQLPVAGWRGFRGTKLFEAACLSRLCSEVREEYLD